MNTLKFLAVGSSLDSGRDVVGRYRVREASLLPRFDPDAESGAAPAIAPAAAPSWWRRILNLLRIPATSPAANPAASIPGDLPNRSETRDLESGPEVIAVASPVATPGPQTEDAVWGQVQKPVQHEFRFENVTVVCNDLHDADFEIVSRPAGRRSPARAMDSRAAVPA